MIINKKDLIKRLEDTIKDLTNYSPDNNEIIIFTIQEVISIVNSMEYETTWDEIFRHLDDDDTRRAIYALDKKRKERESRDKIEIYSAIISEDNSYDSKYFLAHKEAWDYIVDKMKDGSLMELSTTEIYKDKLEEYIR